MSVLGSYFANIDAKDLALKPRFFCASQFVPTMIRRAECTITKTYKLTHSADKFRSCLDK